MLRAETNEDIGETLYTISVRNFVSTQKWKMLMEKRFYKQELLSRLEFLAAKLEEEGRATKIIRDAIAYISKDNV